LQADVFNIAIQILLFAVLVAAATTDVLYRKIFNWITYPGIAFGLTLGYCAGDLDSHLQGLALGAGLFGLVALTGACGPGDWKLMAAIGAIKGYPFVLIGICYSSLVGCAIALVYLAYVGRVGIGLKRSARAAVGLKNAELPESDPAKQRLPYGVAIAFGTIFAWALVEKVI
jgi:Flp pilus assembly protein protease CpaA